MTNSKKTHSQEALITVKSLVKRFEKKQGTIFRRTKSTVHAVNNVNFSIKKGEILGIIGESGCGKTTTARMVMRLTKETSGQILFDGQDLCQMGERELRRARQEMQMIFQDPYDSLNPGMPILEILMEPLNAHKMEVPFEEKRKLVIEILEHIDMKPAETFLYRYPHQLSGGQRQRIAIARALILKPKFVAADEPTSMLDVSVRMGILQLLKSLKEEMGLTMLFITHDLSTAAFMCDRIAVMYRGNIVEIGPIKEIISNPTHPYTKALVAVVSDLHHFLGHRHEMILDGEVQNEVVQGGCPFLARCPQQMDTCQNSIPKLEQLSNDHYVSCFHLHPESLISANKQAN
ncbi:dipeptide/oligopeptide/nickel ABC transporter ATP-binding protein [Brevibacillus choshinensis]|uniref:Dipeptide/oligopeptide/nickel ABC transporter ATP-binding protein n=1 Tax=Brevibacillus choshinensis TaxID=54911 RepID=A0ABR5NE60_BRECH|nr:oligopeptide/dipeptide ABC transporter ATP-binding protein [Brevibacillus choshinensis]KQL49824.1 dipeptide/oligopeptide/nickel ABC transporter ATP-binding protein [Brevibacillus choshinensis]